VIGGAVALGRMLGWPWWGVTLALVAAAIVLQLAIGLRSAPGHLGAVSVANDDPLMIAALEQARQTWDTFVRLYPDHRDASIVKFRFTTKSGEVENVWAHLLDLGSAEATVYLRTPPVRGPAPNDPQLIVPVADIVDWQIMLPDSTLRGGFTQQATFRILERDRGRLSTKYAEQLARYRPLDAST
jgi:uncharacterized protein YegJ (DUF2314 family)